MRRGTDVTLVGHGAMVTTLLQAAALAESRGHVSCEVVDLRSLSPVDYGPILDSVRRTGRMVYAQEAPGSPRSAPRSRRPSWSGRSTRSRLPSSACRASTRPFPPAKLEGTYLPDADRILEAVDRALAY